MLLKPFSIYTPSLKSIRLYVAVYSILQFGTRVINYHRKKFEQRAPTKFCCKAGFTAVKMWEMFVKGFNLKKRKLCMICAACVDCRTTGIARCSRKWLNHTPYSPDFSLPNYFAFPKLKMELEGDRYATISDIQTSVTTKLKTIPITDFSRAMHRLEDRANQCIAVNGDYFKLKNLFRIFWNFFLWFLKQSLKTYGMHCVYQVCFKSNSTDFFLLHQMTLMVHCGVYMFSRLVRVHIQKYVLLVFLY